MNDASEQNRPPNSSRTVLIALALLFILPIVVAWFFTIGPVQWRPDNTINKGTLLQPPLALIGLKTAENKPLSWDKPPGKWYLVALARPGCSEGCQELLAVTAKVEAALGKDIVRVRRAVLHAGPGVPTMNADAVLWIDEQGATADAVAQALALSKLYQAVLIVDYAGRVALAYPPPYNGNDILRDLSRLLRTSKSPGQ